MTRKRIFVSAACIVFLTAAVSIAFCPRPDLYGDITFSTAVGDRHGRLLRLALAKDDRYRLKASLDQISSSVIDATLLYEDRHFHNHPGVNPAALVRAAWSTYITQNRVVGGSTITMQLARLRFNLETRSLGGKLQQIVRAIQLERHYSKDQILEAYLNLAPYGGNVEGVAAASLILFDKPASDLSLPEALALAVIPQNPVRRNPQTAEGHSRLMAARGRLLELWANRVGASDELIARFDLPLVFRPAREMPFHAPHFSQRLLQASPSFEGLLTSTLDGSLQQSLERQLVHYVERRKNIGINNASAMLIDHRSMDVIAAVGSANFFDDRIAGQVNGTNSKRSPGSTLKPFVYGMAIDKGLIHPMSLMKDAPRRFAAYTPENFDRGFMGPISAQDALIYSRNVPAIDLLSRVGHDEFHRFLQDAGVSDLKSPDHYGLAMVLGGNELTMMELVQLYAMLANGGIVKPLRFRLDDRNEHRGRELMSREASFLVVDMLQKNARPDDLEIGKTNTRVPVAWKTGTSYAFRDAWTVGIAGPYVLAVWVGNFDGSGNPEFVGRQAAAPLFFAITDELLSGHSNHQPQTDPPLALNLRRLPMCLATGDLPGRHCPQTVDSWFVPGVSPIRVSDVHRAIRVDNVTGERVCEFDAETTHEEVYEFWPSDILRVFRKAGIAVRSPPPWSAGCALDLQATTGVRPQITSPSNSVTYHIRPNRVDDELLPLTATADADVQWIYWFANNSFVARAQRDEAVFWRPESGNYDILAVDDLGRSASTTLSVSVAQ